MGQEFNWKTKDGIDIYGVNWKVEQPKAVVALIHGLGEHSRRYDHLAAYFNQKNYAVVGYDRRGHGQSEGKRGHTKNYDSFLDEVTDLLAETKKAYPTAPTFIYAHSMGGNIGLNYVLKYRPDIVGTVTTGAWIKLALPTPTLLVYLSKIIRAIYPGLTFSNKLDGNLITSIPEEARKYEQDPLVHAKITAATAVEMLAAAKRLEEYKGAFPTPLLMMHGESDPIVDPESSRGFVKQVTGDISHQEFKGLHEVHYENTEIRTALFNRALNWMDDQLAKR